MKKILFAAASAVSLMACGGGAPTKQYLMALDASTTTQGGSGQCSAAQPGNNVHTTTGKSESFAIFYDAQDGSTYVDFDGHTFTGKKSGDTLTATDIQSSDDKTDSTNEIVSRKAYTLTLKFDGDFVTGSYVYENLQTQSGNTSANTDCVRTQAVRGRQLPDDGSLAPVPSPN